MATNHPVTMTEDQPMTTVDVSIRQRGTRDYLSLRNGLFGPATSLFHAILAACQDGTAEGTWSPSHADVQLPCAILRPMLTELDHLDQLWHGTTETDVIAYPDVITDDARYELHATEV